MISVPCGTDDIADAMISARQIYHTAAPYIISHKRYIIKKYTVYPLLRQIIFQDFLKLYVSTPNNTRISALVEKHIREIHVR